jgi:hypothetical protein
MKGSRTGRIGQKLRIRRGRWLIWGLLIMALSAMDSEAAPRWWVKHEWTQTDTALQLSYTALHIADWGQTLDIENHPNRYETNPILGANPTRGEINTYFATTLGLHWLIARVLPQKWRTQFQLGTIALEFNVVNDNRSAGIRVNF